MKGMVDQLKDALRLPQGDEVHLAYFRLDLPDPVVAELERVLSTAEWARVSRFQVAEDARRCVVRRGILRHLLGTLLDVPPESLLFGLGPQGKPGLAPPFARHNLHFNLSDSGEMALFAWTTGGEIGVDIEEVRPMPHALAVAQRFFAEAELTWLSQQPADQRDAAFLRCWTCKEAVVKALGDGLMAPLQRFSAAHWADPPRVEWLEDTTAAACHWSLHLPGAPHGWVAALAAPSPVRVSVIEYGLLQ